MILWEMATMTKPFGAMGRDQFFHDVVSPAPVVSVRTDGEIFVFVHLCTDTILDLGLAL